MEKAMATHSSTLAWKIPWMEEPGGLQSMGSRRVGHNWTNSLSLSCIGEANGNPPQCSCLENPRDGGAWWAAVYGVAQSWTRLKRLSSRSSIELVNFTFFHISGWGIDELLWCWMICLGNELKLFFVFWDYTQGLHCGLFLLTMRAPPFLVMDSCPQE